MPAFTFLLSLTFPIFSLERFPNPESAAAAARRALEMAARGVSVIEFEQKKRPNLQERIAQLGAELDKLLKDKAQALAEYRAGLYCSQCQRTPTEILPEDFQEHLRRVQGTAIRPSEEAIRGKEEQFDEAIARKQEELQRLRTERALSRVHEDKARGEVIEAHRSFQEADWWHARLVQEKAWGDELEAQRLQAVRVEAERAERDALERARRLEVLFRGLPRNPDETFEDLERRMRAGGEWQDAYLAWERARLARLGAQERQRRHAEATKNRSDSWQTERAAAGQRLGTLLERATGSRLPPIDGRFTPPWLPGRPSLAVGSRGPASTGESPSAIPPLSGIGQREGGYSDRLAEWFGEGRDSIRRGLEDPVRSLGESLLDQAVDGDTPSFRLGLADFVESRLGDAWKDATRSLERRAFGGQTLAEAAGMTEAERDVWEAAAERISRPFSVRAGNELVDSFGRYWDESMQKIFGDQEEKDR